MQKNVLLHILHPGNLRGCPRGGRPFSLHNCHAAVQPTRTDHSLLSRLAARVVHAKLSCVIAFASSSAWMAKRGLEPATLGATVVVPCAQ